MTTNLRSGRPATRDGWLTPSQHVAWGGAIRAALMANPEATIAQLVARTGAPPDLTRKVRQLWVRRLEIRAQ